MDWICKLYSTTDINLNSSTADMIFNYSFSFQKNASSADFSMDIQNPHAEFEHTVQVIIIPTLCSIGILGNLFNFVIFTYTLRQKIGQIETTAILGLIALGVSDLLFCAITVCGTFTTLHGDSVIFAQRNFLYCVRIYGNYLQNVFLKMSNNLVMFIAIFRYLASNHALYARANIKGLHAVACTLFSFIFWILLYLPLLWEWEVNVINCGGQELLFISLGKYYFYPLIERIFTNLWAISGFVIPFCIILFCNLKIMIKSFERFKKRSTTRTPKSSKTKRHEYRNEHICKHSWKKFCNCSKETFDCHRKRNAVANCVNHINITLLSICLAFLLFQSPSEVLHIIELYSDISHINMDIGILVCNLLQTLNMSCNFPLYCLVNSRFRQVIKKLLLKRGGVTKGGERQTHKTRNTRFKAIIVILTEETAV